MNVFFDKNINQSMAKMRCFSKKDVKIVEHWEFRPQTYNGLWRPGYVLLVLHVFAPIYYYNFLNLASSVLKIWVKSSFKVSQTFSHFNSINIYLASSG